MEKVEFLGRSTTQPPQTGCHNQSHSCGAGR